LSRTALKLLVVGLLACQNAPAQQGSAPRSPTPPSISGTLAVDTIASGLEHPWGVALLPDGRFLVTERPGRIRIVEADGRISQPLGGVPPVHASGQGGLLDVTLDPQFAQNRTLYISYAEPGARGSAGTTVARARLGANALEGFQVIYRQEPKVRSGGHFGSRVLVRNDGTLFITQGDRFSYKDRAQDLTSGVGKVVRVNKDGSIPRDNPFVGRSDARPEIWSYGHRNQQAAALHPETGALWTVEHGAAGGDELNHPEAGKNYGWPVITYGRDYSGRSIGEGQMKEGMEQPVYYWDPVIAPSGMTFYTGDAFPGWKGSALIGGMGPRALVRLTFSNGAVANEERYELRARVRDVQQGSDGLIYLVTDDSNGKLLRVRPRARR
jgi:glucose/arabinose dehydrogenase